MDNRHDPRYRLAVKVVNLRRALEAANRWIHELDPNAFRVLACEDEGPMFHEARRFNAEVRETVISVETS